MTTTLDNPLTSHGANTATQTPATTAPAPPPGAPPPPRPPPPPPPACRFCGHALSHTFVDLGSSPLCQRHIEPHQWNEMEPFYPLHAYVCDRCFLVQLDEYVTPATIF